MVSNRRALRKTNIANASALLPDLSGIVADYANPRNDIDALCTALESEMTPENTVDWILTKTRFGDVFRIVIQPDQQSSSDFEFKMYSATIHTPGWIQSDYGSTKFTIDVLLDPMVLWQQFVVDLAQQPQFANCAGLYLELWRPLDYTLTESYTMFLNEKLSRYR